MLPRRKGRLIVKDLAGEMTISTSLYVPDARQHENPTQRIDRVEPFFLSMPATVHSQSRSLRRCNLRVLPTGRAALEPPRKPNQRASRSPPTPSQIVFFDSSRELSHPPESTRKRFESSVRLWGRVQVASECGCHRSGPRVPVRLRNPIPTYRVNLRIRTQVVIERIRTLIIRQQKAVLVDTGIAYQNQCPSDSRQGV